MLQTNNNKKKIEKKIMEHNKRKKGILNFLFIYFVSLLRILSRLNTEKKNKLNNKKKYKFFLSFKDKY
jgi:hypothetical protein